MDGMIRILKNKIIVALVLAVFTVSLTACGSLDGTRKVVFTTGFSDDEIFRIEDSVCSIQEIMAYLINTQNG